METEEELDVELEGEEVPPAEEEGTEIEGGEKVKDDPRITALQAKIDELAGRPNNSGQMDQLLELGKQFLAKQNAAPLGTSDEDKRQYGEFGKKIQDAILQNSPEEAGEFIAKALREFSVRGASDVINERSGPVIEKAGQFATQAFLSSMKDQQGPNGEQLHRLVAKNFALTPREMQFVATASAADTKEFLEGKYERAAGKVLLSSRKNARPRDISGGGGGGKGASVTTFPGLDATQDKRMQEFAEMLWPDEKTRAIKIKALGPRFKEAAG